MNRRIFSLSALFLALGLGIPLHAESYKLVLEGDINGGKPISLSDDDLLDLPQTKIITSTQWSQGTLQFSGPSLAEILEHYNAGSGSLRLTALNNYSVELDRALMTANAPIIANRIDDMPFDRRNKGPLWVIFPYDAAEAYQTEIVFMTSVWQLSNITVLSD